MSRQRGAELARVIAAAIAGGGIGEGERLGTKAQLQRDYHVSSGTLDAALRTLQQRGCLVARTGPGGGLFARRPALGERLAIALPGIDAGVTAAECRAAVQALDVLIGAAHERPNPIIVHLCTALTAALNAEPGAAVL